MRVFSIGQAVHSYAIALAPRYPSYGFAFPNINNAQLLQNFAWLKSAHGPIGAQGGIFAIYSIEFQ